MLLKLSDEGSFYYFSLVNTLRTYFMTRHSMSAIRQMLLPFFNKIIIFVTKKSFLTGCFANDDTTKRFGPGSGFR